MIESKVVRVSYSAILAAPREGAVSRTIRKLEKEGWYCVNRSDSEGLFGFGAHTKLTFQREQASFWG